jgi:hypothetical protein
LLGKVSNNLSTKTQNTKKKPDDCNQIQLKQKVNTINPDHALLWEPSKMGKTQESIKFWKSVK